MSTTEEHDAQISCYVKYGSHIRSSTFSHKAAAIYGARGSQTPCDCSSTSLPLYSHWAHVISPNMCPFRTIRSNNKITKTITSQIRDNTTVSVSNRYPLFLQLKTTSKAPTQLKEIRGIGMDNLIINGSIKSP